MSMNVNASARPLPDPGVGEGRSSRPPPRAGKQSRPDGGQAAANGEALLSRQRSGPDSRHLERALDGADADDELVFMNDRHADADGGAGRVLIRDPETGRVWDPDDGPTPDDPERWIEDAESWNEDQRGSDLQAPPYVEAGSLGVRASRETLAAAAANGSTNGADSPASQLQLKSPSEPSTATSKDEEFEAVAKANGWTPVLSDDALPPLGVIDPKRQDGKIAGDGGSGAYEGSVITFELDGETHAVSDRVSPFKHAQLESRIENVAIRRDDDDIEVDLPDSEATDFMNAETTEDGKTVVELFNETMKKEWEDLDTDDPRREYYDLLQVKAALTGGLTYLPNETVEEKLGDWKITDSTTFGDPETMDTASLYGLLDEEGIDARLAELVEDPKVGRGVDELMQGAVDKIENKDELTDKIHDTMMSPEYEDTLRDSPEGGRARFQNDLLSLEHLDPEKAAEVRAHATYGGPAKAIDEKIENGSYSDEALDLAVSDHVKLSLQSTWTSSGLGEFDDDAVDSVVRGKFDDIPEEHRSKAKAFKEAFDVAEKALVDSIEGGTVDGRPDIEDVADRIDEASGDLSPEAARGLDNFVKTALPGGMTSALAATASVYDLTGANDQDRPQDRVAAARLGMVSVATGRPEAGLDDSALGKIVGRPGMADALGLGSGLEPFDEAFAERFPKARDAPDGSAAVTDAINEKLEPAQAEAVDAADGLSGAYDEASPDEQGRILDQVNVQLNADGADGAEMSRVPLSNKLTFVGASLGTLGSFTGTAGGIVDLVKGGSAIDDLRNAGAGSESSAAYAKASFQVLSGTTMTAAAGTALASAIVGGTSAGAALGAASGVFAGVGIAAGVIGLAVMPAVAREQKENANEKTKDFFRGAEEYGFTDEDWGEKLNYLQHVQQHYGLDTERRREAFPADEPVWESQPEQFEDFTKAIEENGGLPKGWFGDWEKDHPDNPLAKIDDDADDPSGHRRFGDSTWIDKQPETGTFEDFKEDVDRVDIDSIEVLEDGRVGFTKDGVDQVVDPLIGKHADRETREDIAEYLTRLHDVARPGGEFDADVAEEIEKLHGRNDDYNEVDDLDAFLNPDEPEAKEDVPDEDLPALGGEGTGDAGTYDDFKEDIDKLDVASIRRDEDDRDVLYFKKDGKWQKLDRNDADGLEDADKLFGYLVELHDLVRPDGELDEDVAGRVDGLFARTDDYNGIGDLKEFLDAPEKPKVEATEIDGGFGDFKEDIDKVDVASIGLGDHGRVEFEKDGEVQVVDPNVGGGTEEEVAEYLTELHELANPDGELDEDVAAEMDDIFGKDDDNNDVEDVAEELEG